METAEIVRLLQPWKDKYTRPSWKPIVQSGDSDLTSAKFSGTPWMAETDSWPLCKACHEPLQLFLQLNLADLPQPLLGKFGDGLLQLFYCTGDINGKCDVPDGWQPFSDTSSFVRIIEPIGPTLENNIAKAQGYFPAKTIINWEEFLDYPDTAEHEELGLEYIYDFKAGTVNLKCKELNLEFEKIRDDYLAENISVAATGDKLSGWPRWIQGVEYPTCSICKTRMVFIFQIESEDNLPYSLGDLGTGHITQCPNHKDIVAFGWACT